MHKYLFVLSPPYAGSTVLWRLLCTSANVSAFRVEGQMLPDAKPLLRGDHWNPHKEVDWEAVKAMWERCWDSSKAVLLEKSPPHLVRAESLATHFVPASFVLLVRDPYAFSEGYMRRKGCSAEVAARFWVFCARWTLKNLEVLERKILISYEEIVQDPTQAAVRLLSFCPELGALDTTQQFSARTIRGRGSKQLTDYNALKIGQLSRREIAEITSVLEENETVIGRLGYATREVNLAHDLRRLSSSTYLTLVRSTQRVRRAMRRALN